MSALERRDLPAAFADQAGGAEQHGKEVAEGAEGDEEVEAAHGVARAKDAGEEEGGGNLARLAELGLGDGGEVGDVSKYVEDRDDNQGEESVPPELLDGVLTGLDRIRPGWRECSTLTSLTTLKAFSNPA